MPRGRFQPERVAADQENIFKCRRVQLDPGCLRFYIGPVEEPEPESASYPSERHRSPEIETGGQPPFAHQVGYIQRSGRTQEFGHRIYDVEYRTYGLHTYFRNGKFVFRPRESCGIVEKGRKIVRHRYMRSAHPPRSRRREYEGSYFDGPARGDQD